MSPPIFRRSSLSAAVALRQISQRAQKAGAGGAVDAVPPASLDLSISPPARFRQIAAATRAAETEKVACAATRDPLNPSLLAAQAKDAQLLNKVLDDFMHRAAGNWQLEFTTLQYQQAIESGKVFELSTDYLAALALARGSSMNGAGVSLSQ